MADDTETTELLRKLAEEIRKSGSSFSKLADSLEKVMKQDAASAQRENASFLKRLQQTFSSQGSSRYTKGVENQINDTVTSFGVLGRSADAASSSLQAFAKSLSGGIMGSLTGDLRSVSDMADDANASLGTFGSNIGSLSDKMSKAISALAAQPDQIGQVFSRLMGETDELTKRLQGATPEEALKLQNEIIGKFSKEAGAQLNVLRASASAGNQAARDALAALEENARMAERVRSRTLASKVSAASPSIGAGGDQALAQMLGTLDNKIVSGTKAVGGVWGSIITSSMAMGKKTSRAFGGMYNFARRGERSAEDLGNSLAIFAKSADDAANDLRYLLRNVLGGVAIAALIGYFQGLTRQYTSLMDSGARFSDGLLGMSRAAARSGQSLEEFAAFVQQNSQAAALIGGAESLGIFAAQVRKESERFGMFGYSLDGLNEVTSEYLNTLRLTTDLSKINRDETSRSIRSLARDATALSGLFGKNRKEIIQDAEEAQRNELYVSRLMLETTNNQIRIKDTMGKAITALAGLPGLAGKILPNMLAETAGVGTAVFSDGGKMFIEAGMGAIIPQLEDLAGRMKDATPEQAIDLTGEFYNSLRREVEANMESLRVQALAGNTNARQVLKMYQESKDYDAANLKRQREMAEQTDRLTRNVLSFSNIWGRLSGDIRERIINFAERFINGFMSGVDKFSKSDNIDKITASFNKIMNVLAKWFGVELSSNMGENVGTLVYAMFEKIVGYIERFAGYIEKFNSVGSFLGSLDTTTWVALGAAFTTLTGLTPALAGFAGALVALLASSGVKALMQGAGSLLSDGMAGSRNPGAKAPGGGSPGGRLSAFGRVAGAGVAMAAPLLATQELAFGTTEAQDKSLKDADARRKALEEKYGKETLQKARSQYAPWYEFGYMSTSVDDLEKYAQRYTGSDPNQTPSAQAAAAARQRAMAAFPTAALAETGRLRSGAQEHYDGVMKSVSIPSAVEAQDTTQSLASLRDKMANLSLEIQDKGIETREFQTLAKEMEGTRKAIEEQTALLTEQLRQNNRLTREGNRSLANNDGR